MAKNKQATNRTGKVELNEEKKHTSSLLSFGSGTRNKSRTFSINTFVRVDDIDERLRACLRERTRTPLTEEGFRERGEGFKTSLGDVLNRRTVE